MIKNWARTRIGTYEIIQRNGKNQRGYALWKGRCVNCGDERDFTSTILEAGTCRPCSCVVNKRREEAREKIELEDYKIILKDYLWKRVHHSRHINPENMPPEIKLSKQRENLKGQNINGIEILYPCGFNRDRRVMYVCRCHCGNYFLSNHKNLKSGITKSCDCLRNKRVVETNVSRTKEIIGQKFGKLTVISSAGYETGNNGKRNALYKCKCDRGRECIKKGTYLRCGDTKSCGLCRMSSAGEAKIADILDSKKIDYAAQYSFSDCLSPKGYRLFYDFVLFKNNKLKCLIEFDGEQHYVNEPRFTIFFGDYKSLHERDLIKNNYCKENSLLLYRIRFDDNIEEEMEKIINEL